MPYEWFLALEQAEGRELFSSPGHMSRLGFLVDPPHPRYNPHGLPVGFAKKTLALDKGIHACWKGNWVGFGCAACHTGQVNYRGYQIRIIGGPAHHDIESFQASLGQAISALGSSDSKFARFVQSVRELDQQVAPEALATALKCYTQYVRANRSFVEMAQSLAAEVPTASGLARLDAHERNFNLFLAGPLAETRNYVPETAPVSYPALWDTPYFDWVLYNSSIRQPLARNIIEALGVQAPIDHTTIFTEKVVHSLNLESIVEGQRAVMDLMSPPWPEEILGAIDKERAARGAKIYAQQCSSCHAVLERTQHSEVGAIANKDREITVPVFPIEQIGTDPRQATTFARRLANLSKVGGPAELSSFAAGQLVTEKIATQWTSKSPENASRAAEINLGRPNEFRGVLQYRARPLNGIWATAPYLHNGSVPNLRELLMPTVQRSKVLYIGNWDFDPVNVGYETASPFPGATLLDTRLPGNSNAGHEFGADLTDTDRAALIEYLKSL
jgi:hypothetical protein